MARRVLPRISWLLPLVWFYLATDRVRNAPLFALLTMLAIAEMLPFTAWRTWLFRHDWVRTPERSGIYRRSRRATLGMATVATLVLGGAMSAVGWAQLDPQRWPLDLLPELTALDERTPPGEPIFNAMIDGGFLTFHCRGLKTFIDDRCELAGEQTLHAYAEAERNHPAQIDVWQAEYGFEHALVRNDTPFDQHLMLSPDWRVIRRGSCATLYRHVKADPASGSTAYNGRARSTVKPNQPLLRTLINTSDLLKNFGSPQFDKLQS